MYSVKHFRVRYFGEEPYSTGGNKIEQHDKFSMQLESLTFGAEGGLRQRRRRCSVGVTGTRHVVTIPFPPYLRRRRRISTPFALLRSHITFSRSLACARWRERKRESSRESCCARWREREIEREWLRASHFYSQRILQRARARPTREGATSVSRRTFSCKFARDVIN